MTVEYITAGLTAVNSVGLGYFLWRSGYILPSQRLKNQMVVDTSGLIDGRLVDIVQSGFVPRLIVIPQFVVAELQFLADQADNFKRERARYGLEVVRRLQDMRQTEVIIKPGLARGIKEVDDKLVALTKRTGAMLYTTDFNLNQVAQIAGVRVLNVNELAQGLRATLLPGEKAEIKITQGGQDRSQGVGYLDDGTMVVVERAGSKMGHKVQVQFTRMLQTQAGKMMFAVLVEQNRPQKQQNNSQPQQAHLQQKNKKIEPAPKPAKAPEVAVTAPDEPKNDVPAAPKRRSRNRKRSPGAAGAQNTPQQPENVL